MSPDYSDAMRRGYLDGYLDGLVRAHRRWVDSLPPWWDWRDPIGNLYRYEAERTTPQWVRELLDGLG